MPLLGFQGRRGGQTLSPAVVQVTGQQAQNLPAPGEARLFWDESYRWISTTQAQDMVDRLAAANFNAIAPFIWHGNGKAWGYDIHGLTPTYSRFESSGPFVSKWDQAHDSFSDLITRAHAAGIAVYPVFTMCLRQNSDIHFEWRANPAPADFYDVRNSFFRDWLMDMIAEVIDFYDIDGFLSDYTRTGSSAWNNTNWQTEYSSLYPGANMATDRNVLVSAFDENDPRAVESLAEYRYVNFHESAVGDLVRRTRALLRAKDPNLVHIMYGDPWGIIGGRDEGRTPNKWLEEGDIDVIAHATYHVGDLGQPTWTDFSSRVLARSHLIKPEAYTVICSNYMTDPVTHKFTRPRTGAEVNTILTMPLEEGAVALEPGNGRQLYLFNQFTDDQKNALAAGVFHFPAELYWNRTVGQLVQSSTVGVEGQHAAIGEVAPIVTDAGRLSSATGNNISGSITVPEGSEGILVLLAPIRNLAATGLVLDTITYDDVELDELQALVLPATVNQCPGIAAFTLLTPSTGANTLAVTWTAGTAANCSSVLVQVYSFTGLASTDPWGTVETIAINTITAATVGVDILTTVPNSRVCGLGHICNFSNNPGSAAGDVTGNVATWQTGTHAVHDSAGVSGVIEAGQVDTYRWQADFTNGTRRAAIAVEVRGE